jgi:asparagine synthase (glutamine-hydrolysing)
MTAILAMVALDGAALAPADFAAGVAALGGFAAHGAERHIATGMHLWAARSAHASLLATDTGCVIVIDGRLRDRTEFFRRHGVATGLSDAQALLDVYRRMGIKLFDQLDADIALLLVDAPQRRVLMYRDPMGERGLRYAVDGDCLYVATRGSALCALRGQALVAEPVALAHYVALRSPPEATAWMQGVGELVSGGLWISESGRIRQQRIAPRLPDIQLRFASDEDAAAAWNDALVNAVRRAGMDSTHTGVMLSGGIDSTLLAASARACQPLAFSWALPGFPECNEAPLAAATAQALGMAHRTIDGDALTPLSHLSQWPVEDEAPIVNPYRWLIQSVFEQARSAQVDVLLSGNFGDHLYSDDPRWMASVHAERGLMACLTGLAASARALPPRDFLRGLGLRNFLRTPAHEASLPDWLTAEARVLLAPTEAAADGWIDAQRRARAFGRASAQDAELARRFTNACGLEVRFPYRDPELLHTALAMPAHYFSAWRGNKWLSRRVLAGRVPAALHARPKAGSLAPFFRHGLLGPARPQVETLLQHPDVIWPRYLQRERVQQALGNAERSDDESTLLLIWLAIGLELWSQAHAGCGPAVLASKAFLSRGDEL